MADNLNKQNWCSIWTHTN